MALPEHPGLRDLSEIGRGGFGVVYRARQEQLDRDVAVKFLTALPDERSQSRFAQECRALGQLSGHPHIVEVHDGGVRDDGQAYLVMPYYDNGSLAARLKKAGPMRWPDVVDIGVRLAGALQTAHDAGILHRDLKPANVLLDDYDGPRLADFGQARLADTAPTRTGETAITPGFTAPEVLNGERATVQSDVYSLGATLLALLLGQAPFQAGGDLVAIFYRVVTEPPPDVRPLGVPDRVATILERALSKSAAHRYAAAQQFGSDLRTAQQELGVPPSPLVVARRPAAALPPVETVPTDPSGQRPEVGSVPASRSEPAPTPPPGTPSGAAGGAIPVWSSSGADAAGRPSTPGSYHGASAAPSAPGSYGGAAGPPGPGSYGGAAGPSGPAEPLGWGSPPQPLSTRPPRPPAKAVATRRRRMLPAVAILAAVIALAAAGVFLLRVLDNRGNDDLADGAGGRTEATTATTDSTTEPPPASGTTPAAPSTTVSTPPPAPPGQADVSAVAGDPDATAVGETLSAYFIGVNDRDFDTAYAVFSPGLRDRIGFDQWSTGLTTTTDSDVAVVGLERGADGLLVQTRFTSRQAAANGPTPGETCTNWTLVYTLTTNADGPASYQIAAVDDVGPGHTAC